MFTIVILAILTAVALPSYRSFVVSQRIKNTSFDVMASLITARSEAIKRNVSVDVTPAGGNWTNGWTVGLTGTGPILKNQSALNSGVSVVCYSGTALQATCPTITYNSSGRLTGVAAPSIQITTTDASVAAGVATRCINVDLSGRPNSKKANCP